MTQNVNDTLAHTGIEVIESIKNTSVLVVGDIMLDRFVYGDVNRISPESPVPVLSVQRENKMLGGAGNTLSNLRHLECGAKIIATVGDDAQGEEVKSMLRQWGLSDEYIFASNDRPTIVKTRFLAGHQQLLRTDYERVKPIEPGVEDKITLAVKGVLPTVQAMIISDYGKGTLTPNLLSAMIKLANKYNVPVLVDPKGADYSIYKGADFVTPNKKELSEATRGLPVDTDE